MAEPGKLSNQHLLSRLKKGDEQAWILLLREWQEPLYQYFSYALPDPTLAGEALGATLESIIRSIPHYDGSVPLTVFFYSLAAQRVSMYYRKRKGAKRRNPMTAKVDGHKTNAPKAGNGKINGRPDSFRTILDLVPQRQRQALLLRYHLGLSVAEIADILGQSAAETEQVLAQGSRQLHDALGSAGYQ